MRVDFYQLDGEGQAVGVLAAIAGKLLGQSERLLVTGADKVQLASLDRQLWEEGSESFLAHGREGGSDDVRQPILLSTRTVAANRARHLAIVDGEWRPVALNFERAFYLFDAATLDGARAAWRDLSGHEDVSRKYWAIEESRWVQRG